MTIQEILRKKGTDVVTVAPEDTILAAMRVLVHHRIGAVVVLHEDRVAGILSERDVLRTGAEEPASLETLRVADAMTSPVITAVVEDDLEHVMEVMTERRIRHLPIMDGDRLAGIVSIGDVVNQCRKRAEGENAYLRQYIQGAS